MKLGLDDAGMEELFWKSQIASLRTYKLLFFSYVAFGRIIIIVTVELSVEY